MFTTSPHHMSDLWIDMRLENAFVCRCPVKKSIICFMGIALYHYMYIKSLPISFGQSVALLFVYVGLDMLAKDSNLSTRKKSFPSIQITPGLVRNYFFCGVSNILDAEHLYRKPLPQLASVTSFWSVTPLTLNQF